MVRFPPVTSFGRSTLREKVRHHLKSCPEGSRQSAFFDKTIIYNLVDFRWIIKIPGVYIQDLDRTRILI